MGNDPDKEQPVIAVFHIRRRMARKLRLAAALCRKEAECDQLPLRVRQPCTGIIITEAVICQTQINVPAFLRPGSPEMPPPGK